MVSVVTDASDRVMDSADAAASPGPGSTRSARRAGVELFRPLADQSVGRAVVEAYGACVDRWGRSKTTMADVAREAGVSRATLYRVVPGKEALHELHRRHGLASFFAELDAELPDDAPLPDLLAAALSRAARLVADDGRLRRRLVDDPGAVLPGITFRGLDRIFAACRVFIAPRLEAHLDPVTAARTSEWLARLVLWPVLDERAPFDLTDPDQVADLVTRRLLPALPAPAPMPTSGAQETP